MEPEIHIQEEESFEAPKFEVLVERFRAKVGMIPEDCRQAILYWHMAKRVQESRMTMNSRVGQIIKIGQKVFWSNNVPDEIKSVMDEDPKQIKQIKLLEDKYVRLCEKNFKQSRWYNEVALPAAEGIGLGPLLAGSLLWTIGDAKRFESFGKIIRYAGLDVTQDGKSPKRRKGQRVSWSPELRTTIFKLTEGWNKMPESVWRARWDAFKAIYRERFPDKEIYIEGCKKKTRYNDGHIHNMARRKVQREFLRNLYHLWIEFE